MSSFSQGGAILVGRQQTAEELAKYESQNFMD